MSYTLIAACIWVVAAAITALLPMRYQIYPGLPLLLLAPVLIVAIALEHNVWLVLAAVAGFASMFRKPLLHLYRKYVRPNLASSGKGEGL